MERTLPARYVRDPFVKTSRRCTHLFIVTVVARHDAGLKMPLKLSVFKKKTYLHLIKAK